MKHLKKEITPKPKANTRLTQASKDRHQRRKEVQETFSLMDKNDLKNMSEGEILKLMSKYYD